MENIDEKILKQKETLEEFEKQRFSEETVQKEKSSRFSREPLR